ncbi:MAG: 50S ribosomal protein L28 [SAR202 cluster bacterium]|nr:MAG: 50S ribosomal protein L28 [SAR202 cluster bacterium]MCH2318864.1 50S ribosomal protein L28 [SAR202 cluster bacterium]MQG75587.1 50S ribosomal protein L28 [SAR202 cluster bacterium]
MASCQICNKTGISGNNVSHSKRRTRTRWRANIQRAFVEIGGVMQKANVCTRCLRTQYKHSMKD